MQRQQQNEKHKRKLIKLVVVFVGFQTKNFYYSGQVNTTKRKRIILISRSPAKKIANRLIHATSNLHDIAVTL